MKVIDKNLSTPYYEQLADMLRQEIIQRESHGEVFQLPSENELAERHGITRTTVRHALTVLEQEGRIYREKGKGSFAAVRRVQHDLTRLVSTTEDMKNRGWELVTKVVSIEQMPATDHIAQALEIPSAGSVYEICRLRIVDEEPISLQTAYLPVELCPNLETHDLSHSLYRLLETHYGLRLWTGKEVLRAVCPGPEETDILQLPPDVALMYLERITYGANGMAVEYLESFWRGDFYDFTVPLARP